MTSILLLKSIIAPNDMISKAETDLEMNLYPFFTLACQFDALLCPKYRRPTHPKGRRWRPQLGEKARLRRVFPTDLRRPPTSPSAPPGGGRRKKTWLGKASEPIAHVAGLARRLGELRPSESPEKFLTIKKAAFAAFLMFLRYSALTTASRVQPWSNSMVPL